MTQHELIPKPPVNRMAGLSRWERAARIDEEVKSELRNWLISVRQFGLTLRLGVIPVVMVSLLLGLTGTSAGAGVIPEAGSPGNPGSVARDPDGTPRLQFK